MLALSLEGPPLFLLCPSQAFATYTRLEFAFRPVRRNNQEIMPKKRIIATISREYPGAIPMVCRTTM